MTDEIIHVPAQFPDFYPPTKIAYIAEAPSTEEIDQGVPLIGPSGKIFNQMLRTANINRYDHFVGNVFDEKLPNNNVKNWCADMKAAKDGGFNDIPPIGSNGYLKSEHRWHLDRLKAELEVADPTVIVPLGATALWAFMGTDQISNYRGTVVPAKYILPGIKLIPTFHPAFVMRQWKFFPVVVGDFIRANNEARYGKSIRHPKRQLWLEPTIADIKKFLPRIMASDLLSVDIETGWGQITCIGFAPNSEEAICIPFIDKRKPSRSYWKTADEEMEVWQIVKNIMESDVPKLGQNFGGYDAYWFIDKVGIKPRNFRHDTRLMQHALYPELPKDLQFMGASYTQQGPWKNWGHKGDKRDD